MARTRPDDAGCRWAVSGCLHCAVGVERQVCRPPEGVVSDTGNSVRLRAGRSMNLSETNEDASGVDLRQALIEAARAQVQQLSESSQALLRLEFQRAEDQARAVIFSGAARSL